MPAQAPSISIGDINLDRIAADLEQAQDFQIAVWETFGKKVKERDTLAAAKVVDHTALARANAEVAMIDRDMMRAAELVCRLGALYYVFEKGGVQALGRITLGWAARDAQEESNTLSITLG
jgi:hypothetical protein